VSNGVYKPSPVSGSQPMSNGTYKPSPSPPSTSAGAVSFSDVYEDVPSAGSSDDIWIGVGVGIFVLVVGLVIAIMVSHEIILV
jgi:hypothetical protein